MYFVCRSKVILAGKSVKQLQGLFDRCGFLLRKWNSNELEVLLQANKFELPWD